ncbi:MAG: MFS transporter, partial [Anaerolineales bacterium]
VFAVGSWLVAASGGLPAQAMERLVRLFAGGRPDRSLMALYALIAGRVVQAFGAGALVPITMALVGDLYPVQRRAIGLGVVGAVDTAGWVLGHLYGGILVQFVHWTYLFWINLPIAVVSFGLIAWVLQDLSLPAHRSVIKGGVPLLNLRTFLDRHLAAAFSANLLVGFSLMVGLVSVPLFINLAGAESGEQGALASGVMLSAFTIPMALAAVPGGWLASRYGDRRITAVGVLIALGGFALMTSWQPEYARQAAQFVAGLGEPGGVPREALAGAAAMAAGLCLAGVGLGLTIAPIGSTVINGVKDSERGLASALVIVLRLIGMSLSVSTLTRYGLRRSTELSQELLAGVGLTELGRIAEAGIQVATRITVEMAGIAVAVCALALIPSLLMRPKSLGAAPEQAASSPG